MKKYFIAFIIILIIVSILEIFLFNFNHYRTRFGNFEEKKYTIEQVAFFDDNNVHFEIIDIDREVGTLNLEFDDSKLENKVIEYQFEYSDETSSGYKRLPSKYYVVGNELTHYIPTYLSGKVSKIRVCINRTHADYLHTITINKEIPFKFNIYRFAFLSIAIFLLFIIHTSNFFKKEYKRNIVSQQLVLFGTLIIAFLFMFWINKYSTYEPDDNVYNKDFVDSVLSGKFDLDGELSEDFLNLENPYDDISRGYVSRGKDYKWDTAYYNGKVYEYFGILPLLLFFLPYRVVFKKYLAIAPVVYILSVCTIIMFKELTEKIINRYFKEIPFKIVFYLVLTLCFGSLIIYINALGRVYELAVISGLFFTMLGMILIFTSIENPEKRYRYIFFGSWSLALSVACRPTDLFASLIIVPYLLQLLVYDIKNFKQKKSLLFKLIFSVGIPYITVGIAMMWYNFVRFDSPFDFGTKYQLTITNMYALKSRQYIIPMGLLTNFFTIPDFIPTFPYIVNQNDLPIFYGYYYVENIISGVFFVAPVSFFVFELINANRYIRNKEYKITVNSLVIVGLFIAIISAYMGGSNQRYIMDYLWMFSFAGIMIYLFLYDYYSSKDVKRILQKVLCLLTIYTVFLGTFSGILSERNYLWERSPDKYSNLRYTINFWE